MISPRRRREFLAAVGRGMLITTVGYQVATALAGEPEEGLSFGSL